MQLVCLETKSRSISDLARDAVMKVVVAGTSQSYGGGVRGTAPNLNGRVDRAEEMLELLIGEVREIKEKLGFPANLALAPPTAGSKLL
jgi:hypothetical protein